MRVFGGGAFTVDIVKFKYFTKWTVTNACNATENAYQSSNKTIPIYSLALSLALHIYYVCMYKPYKPKVEWTNHAWKENAKKGEKWHGH